MSSSSTAGDPAIVVHREDDGCRVAVAGPWVIGTAAGLSRELARVKLEARDGGVARIVGERLTALDSVGALLLARLAGQLEGAGMKVYWLGFSRAYDDFLGAIRALELTEEAGPPGDTLLVRTGKATLELIDLGRRILGFFGLVLFTFVRLVRRPSKIRWTSIVHHIALTGLNAMPIVGLLTFLIGVVLTFLAAHQLARFGAQIFVVDLIGTSLLRELGVLVTAILVAGRSGSAFTAQLGAMRVNEEVDALEAMGLDPMEVLTLPRIIALVIAMPLLSFFGTMMGIFGGMLISDIALHISFAQFVDRLAASVDDRHLFIGLAKAPVYAFIISLIGCFEGFNVSGSAENVGRYTTRSVVEAIFLVIVADAAFAMVFYALKM
ncbi:MAG: ABC transporter permease [Nannocystaceae bacterium]